MSALDEALCWNCPICTLINPLDASACTMCNNPRPMDQYVKLIEIREESRRQKKLYDQQLRLHAMNANSNFVTNDTIISNEEDEEEAAKKLIAQQSDDWNEDDFDDGDAEWDDNSNKDDNDVDFDDNHSIEMNDKTDENIESKTNEDDDWGVLNDDSMAVNEIVVPEKKELFTAMTTHKLHEYEVNIMKDVAESLCMSDLDDVSILLRFYRWNKSQLMDEYLSSPDEIKLKYGIISSSPIKDIEKTVIKKGSFDCCLCISSIDSPLINTFYPPECGHQYCNKCWLNYLISQMEKGPKCIYTRCIDPQCKLVIRSSIFLNFFQNYYKYRVKYNEYTINSFISGMNNLAHCPGASCSMSYKAEYGSPISIDCSLCHTLWCFKCCSLAHLPCTCLLAEKWMTLHSTDSENITYVRAFTKQCPKCKNHIEKNNGCNHMTCRCGYEFCWLCRKDWKKIGYGHQCNKPQHVVEEEESQKTAQSYLKRFMFYCARYEAHEKSANFAKESIKNAKECIRQHIIQRFNNKTYKYGDLQFIEDSIKEIIKCRHILQWSYCYGYYLSDNCSLKVLFETQQGLLESFSDQLHEKIEKRVDDQNMWYQLTEIKFRTETISLTNAVKKYRKNFTESLLDSELPFIYQKGTNNNK